ncbi:MAG TPA: hypothetical protein VIM31_04195 [Candidatus Microsaccharimonas sp.]|jgi:hypothetical protein
MSGKLRFLKSRVVLLIAGILLGAVVILAVRFFTYEPTGTHYHANFAVYINGAREEFAGRSYYEETAANGCSLNPVSAPVERAHMHDKVNDVVHVHDSLVTWANFFENIRWGLGDDYLKTRTAMFLPDSTHKLTFILNGTAVDTIAGTVIGDEDVLLISYGSDDTSALKKEYDGIARTAHHVDVTKDPASCSAGSQVVTFQDRIDHLFK